VNNPFAAVTDKDGCYELLGCGKSQGYSLTAQPQGGLPYFAAWNSVMDGPGNDPLTLDFKLAGGIALEGRILDRATRKPPKAAVVEYYPLLPNTNSALLSPGLVESASSAVTQPDGSYRLAVLPGPGIVCVSASPHDCYAVAVLGREELAKFLEDGKALANPRPDGSNAGSVHNPIAVVEAAGNRPVRVNRYHALSLIKPERTLESMALDFQVEPARMLRGIVTGPDGNPLTGVRVTGLIAAPDAEVLESASFTILGLNPRRSRDLYFHHEELPLGKFVTLQGDENKPLTVQLVPCGAVIGRIVDKARKPAPDVRVQLTRLVEGYCLTVAKAVTDADGRFRMDGLVPGAKHMFVLAGSHRLRTDVSELEVRSGQSQDLGELILDK
jgi:hypothetical protein